MTEQEWLGSDDVDLMLEHAERFSTERQLRLFACACCRHVFDLMIEDRSRNAVNVAELYAKGEVGVEALQAANKAANEAWKECSQYDDDHAAAAAYYCSSLTPTLLPAAANRVQAAVQSKSLERRQQADLLRGIMGNPFVMFQAKGPSTK